MTAPLIGDIPFVDEHRVPVAAPPHVVWPALLRQVAGPRFAASEPLARLLGAEPSRASGTPLEPGATLAGFRVAEAVPGRLLRLAGRHRFSRYSLVLTLNPDERPAPARTHPAETEHDGRTVVSALTYAAFPGPHGAVYRALVIGSGLHRVAVFRLLHAIRRDAEG